MPSAPHSPEEIDFQIRFFEGVVKRKGDFVQALTALGELYTKRGLYEKGLEVDLKLSALRPDDPLVFYNLACSYSLLNRIDDASLAMKKALHFGYDDLKYLSQDKDLENLIKDSRFREYLSRLAQWQARQRKKKTTDAGRQ